jgi:transposase
VAVQLTGGQVHDAVVAEKLTEDVYHRHVLADMGYTPAPFEQRNNMAHIPPKSNAVKPRNYDKLLYKLRKHIENTFGKLKENKRIDTRYDKLEATFLGFIAIGFIKIFCGVFIC